jgi:branched-chain amino acid transport system substrate-binding protein
MSRKKLIGLFSFVLLILVFAVQPGMAADDRTIKIGGLFALTGFGSAAETFAFQGAELAVDWYNEKGGITINGEKYRLQLIPEDIKGTADGAAAAANKLLYDSKVKFCLGTVVPFMVQAAGTVLEPAQVIRVVLYNCGLPDEYGKHTPYMFVAQDATVEGIDPSLDYLKEAYPGVKSISYVIPDDGSVPVLGPIFTEKAKKKGYQVASIEKWAMNTQDFTPIVMKILQSKPDAVAFANGWPQATGGMLKIAREMGFKGPIFGCNYDDGYQILQVAGKESSNDFFVHSLVLDSPEMTPLIKMIVERAKKKHGEAYVTTVWGFQGIYVLAQAIEKAQSLDPTVVRDTWEKMDKIDTVYGPGRMGGFKTYGIKHTVCHPCPIQALKNGQVSWVKWVDVYSE